MGTCRLRFAPLVTVVLYAAALAPAADVTAAADEAPTSQTDQRLARLLERQPEADANKDGVLTLPEARDHMQKLRAERRGDRRNRGQRTPPTHADVAYGEHERHVLDLYLVERDEPTPLVVYIHGGGFVGGNKRGVGGGLIRTMHQHGISVAAIHYRFITTDPLPTAMRDGARALQFLRHHAERYNLDPERFAATGGSAGAGISLWLAMHDDLADPGAEDPVARQSSRVSCALVSGAQVSYDPRFWRDIGLGEGLKHRSFPQMYGRRDGEPPDSPRLIALYEESAPITHLTADDVPVMLTYNVPNEVTGETPMGAIIHHPLHGITLKQRMDPLDIECIVVYPGGEKPPMSGNEFLIRHLTASGEGEVTEADASDGGAE